MRQARKRAARRHVTSAGFRHRAKRRCAAKYGSR
jgi:hypothetical protein